MSSNAQKRAFTIAEAARYAGFSRAMIVFWLDKGLLPFEEYPSQGNGKHRFRVIRRKDLDAFMDAHYRQNARKRKGGSASLLILSSENNG